MEEHSQELDNESDAENSHEEQRDGFQGQILALVVLAWQRDSQAIAVVGSVSISVDENMILTQAIHRYNQYDNLINAVNVIVEELISINCVSKLFIGQ